MDTVTVKFFDGTTDSTAGFTRVIGDPSDSGYVTGDTLQGGEADTYWFVYSAPTAGTVTFNITADFSGTDLVGRGRADQRGSRMTILVKSRWTLNVR